MIARLRRRALHTSERPPCPLWRCECVLKCSLRVPLRPQSGRRAGALRILEQKAAVVRERFRRYTEETSPIGAVTHWSHGQRHPDANGQATVGAEQDLGNAPQPGVSGNGLLSKDCDDAARARPEAPGGCASGAACRSIPPRYGIARAESGSRFPCRRWSPRFSTRWPTPGSPRIAASRRAAPRSRPLLQGSWSVDRAAGAGNPHAMFVRRTEASS
jgi:hypothetical protein